MSNGNDSPIMFKSAVGGFDKKSVISYIFELNETSQAAQKKLKDQLEEVSAARESLDQQLNEANKKIQRMQSDITSLNNQLNGERNRNNEMADEIGRLNTELEQYRERLAQKESELKNATIFRERASDLETSISKYNAEISQLQTALEEKQSAAESEQLFDLHVKIELLETTIQEKNLLIEELQNSAEQENVLQEARSQISDLLETVEGLNVEINRQRELIQEYAQKNAEYENERQGFKLKSEDIEEKQREIDRVSAQVGRLLLEATSDADRMRTDAAHERERVLERAQQDADRIVNDAYHQAKLIAEDAQITMTDARNQIANFRRYINDLQEQLFSTATNIQVKSQDVSRLVEDVELRFSQDVPFQIEEACLPAAVEK